MCELEGLSWSESIVSSILIVGLSSAITNIVIAMNTMGQNLPRFYTKEMMVVIVIMSVILTTILKYDGITKAEIMNGVFGLKTLYLTGVSLDR